MAGDSAMLRRAAMDYLARREHSVQELRHKLLLKCDDNALIEQVIRTLQEDNLQSDLRFAQSYLRSRVQRGFGPQAIKQALKQRGVSSSVIEQAFSAESLDWFAQISSVYETKYGQISTVDAVQKAKQQRFLLSRGFSFEQIQSLWRKH